MNRARLIGVLALAGFAAVPSSVRWPAGEGAGTAQAAGIQWASSFQTAIQQAQAEEKFVMVDFYTGWCHWCKVLDARTYSDPKVASIAERLVSVKVDAEADRATAAKYGVRAYPTIVFLNPDATIRQRVQGFQPPEVFTSTLQDVLKMDSELYGLSHQVLVSPRDTGARAAYAQCLARSGEFAAAVAQLDTILMLDPGKSADRSSIELDRWVWLHRSGRREDVRKGLEKWVKGAKNHPRRLEGQYYLARVDEADGKTKDARKLYQEIAKKSPGSWFAEVARAKLGRS